MGWGAAAVSAHTAVVAVSSFEGGLFPHQWFCHFLAQRRRIFQSHSASAQIFRVSQIFSIVLVCMLEEIARSRFLSLAGAVRAFGKQRLGAGCPLARC